MRLCISCRCSTMQLKALATGSGMTWWSRSNSSTFLPSLITMRPGIPTTVELGGTAFTTTELDPIRLFSPTSKGPRTLAPAPEGRMPLFLFQAHSPKGDTLVEGHIFADLGGLADDNAHPVIDEQPLSDLDRGVYLDTC